MVSTVLSAAAPAVAAGSAPHTACLVQLTRAYFVSKPLCMLNRVAPMHGSKKRQGCKARLPGSTACAAQVVHSWPELNGKQRASGARLYQFGKDRSIETLTGL